MIKITKILIIFAVIIVVITLILAIITSLNQKSKSAQNNLTSQNLYEKHFNSLTLNQDSYSIKERSTIIWQLKPAAGQEIVGFFKILSNQQEIFISQTQPFNFSRQNSADFEIPKKIGEYELWVYLVETDNIQSLVATLPFSVK